MFVNYCLSCHSAELMRYERMGKDLGIVPSTVSHHLKELRRVGLIRVERQGQRIECCVDRSTLGDLQDFFNISTLIMISIHDWGYVDKSGVTKIPFEFDLLKMVVFRIIP